MFTSTLTRRSLLKAGAAGLAAAALPFGVARAQAPIVLGIVYVGPRDDFGWNQAHAVAVEVAEGSCRASPSSRKRTCPRPTPSPSRWNR